jgi:hypothetical protein
VTSRASHKNGPSGDRAKADPQHVPQREAGLPAAVRLLCATSRRQVNNWFGAMPTSHQAYRHTRLEGLFDQPRTRSMLVNILDRLKIFASSETPPLCPLWM